MSVEEINQDNLGEETVGKVVNEELVELKEYATDLGIKFNPNIGLKSLQVKVDAVEQELADKAKAKKAVTKEALNDKVTIIVDHREGEDHPTDQFFGCGSMSTGTREHILIQFGEEVEVSKQMFDHIKNIKFGEKKFKTVVDDDGIPRKHWYTKTKTRFIVSKV